jgi:hypothetical protein
VTLLEGTPVADQLLAKGGRQKTLSKKEKKRGNTKSSSTFFFSFLF